MAYDFNRIFIIIKKPSSQIRKTNTYIEYNQDNVTQNNYLQIQVVLNNAKYIMTISLKIYNIFFYGLM